jgi:STAS domain
VAGPERWSRLPARTLWPPAGPTSVVLVIVPPVRPVDIAGLCDKLRRLVASAPGIDVVTCDVGALVRPDLVVVDALARLQLVARKLGRSIRLRHAGAELLALLGFVGLDEVLPLCPAHNAVTPGPRARLAPGPEPG